jgi:hypothetical protein
MSRQTNTLPNRGHAAGVDRAQRVLNELVRSESLGGAAAVGKLAIAIPLCLVGPFFITVVAKSIELRSGGRALPGFLATWALVTLVLVPLLMWLERRTRGEFFSEAVSGETSPLEASSYGEYHLQSTKFLWTAYTEVALTGPRLLWEFVDWVMQRPVGNASVRAVAAAVVLELLDAGQGLSIRQLVRADRPADVVKGAVRYLLGRDWIGTSKRGDRVWLLTPVRERLAHG